MLRAQMMTAMELLPLVCLCLLTCSAAASADGNEPPVNVTVMENSDAILPCSLSSGENIESTMFDWRKDYQKDGSKDVFMYDGKKQDLLRQSEEFRGRVSHFPDELKNGNASIKITKTKLADGGVYTCIFPNLQPERKFNIELVVGASSKPSVTILDQTKDWSLLQCEVLRALPQPEVEWQDSDGNKVPAKDPQVAERGGSYDIILQATVTKTDTYRCVVTQKEINHHTQAETFVRINESSKSFIGWIVAGVVTFFVTVLVITAILGVLYYKGFITLNCQKASGTNPQSGTTVPLTSS